MAASIDWMPTIAQYCNIRPHEPKFDGKSIVPVIESEDAPSPHDVLHWETGKHWAVREGNWKLVHNGPATEYKGRNIPQVENFLSNMTEDVTETKNLAEAHPEIVERLTGLHNEWIREQDEL
jgi:arylsulfatase A-like enzyme